MFYVALDRETALAETYVRHDGNPAEASIAMFRLMEDLNVLDLVNLPHVPSIFNSNKANLYRAALGFLYEFRDDLTQPIEKDGREHIEYVPSQVVTEFASTTNSRTRSPSLCTEFYLPKFSQRRRARRCLVLRARGSCETTVLGRR